MQARLLRVPKPRTDEVRPPEVTHALLRSFLISNDTRLPTRNISRRIELKSKYLKQGKDPWLFLSVEGAVQTYQSLRSRLSGVPGPIFDDRKQRAYLPQDGGRFFLGVEYEK